VGAVVEAIVTSPANVAAMIFLGVYPLASAVGWIGGSVAFSSRRERRAENAFYAIDARPPVSVVIPAHNEEAVIAETVASVLELDWPELEVVVVDDGSTDGTVRALERWSVEGAVRVVRKRVNEGKAMALDDAIPGLRGEIVLIVDADGRPDPAALRMMVPHFVHDPQVGAVTGNPRVSNTTTLLAKLQAIEFSATVSVLRRAQAAWGQLMTFSGICTALRTEAVASVGAFRPEMATEDIALTWQLERAGYEVRYEPRAVFGMQVPETIGPWWRQRVRWARGLGQVLRRNMPVMRTWRNRYLWPIYLEAAASTLWAHLFFAAIAVWALAFSLGIYHVGGDPVPDFWGMIIASVGLVQIVWGLWLDGRHDATARRYALWAPLYPLAYWALDAAASIRATLAGFARPPRGTVVWGAARYRD
jgi:biofilm PGA synthesis N-glycosyltransferase PgaC